ncbi:MULTISPECIES: ATP-binding protein [unclassified Uliginosibacterium]|uniref:sensor histidine kinase n=1 Tax=unclassified Uliginosibacterium TaxID=2621521 RepID=UPI0013041B5F|nr:MULTISPECIES: sensor histidine kinase [unclassified Uliginosibacterium]MDO6384919.1 ATP-binding protein [Uliginosibacterium sp. 31-12]
MAPPPALPESSQAEPLAGDLLARSAWSFLGIYLLLVVLILAGTWALITQDWVRQQKVQETELSSLAHSLAEMLEHDLADADRALRSLGRMQAKALSANTENLRELARQELLQAPHIARLSIWSAKGQEIMGVQQNMLATTLSSPLPSVELFRRQPQQGLLIHTAIVGADGLRYLPVERIQRGAQGELQGYGVALLEVTTLEQYFRAIRLTDSDQASLLDGDTRLLTSMPVETDAPMPDFRRLLASQANGQRPDKAFGTTYEIDGESQVGVFRWLSRYPLIVEAARPTAVARAGFTAMKRRLLTGAGALIGLLGLLTWLIYADSQRHRSARASLGRINASLEERVSRRTAELEQSNREMIAFSYSISHDLRAPLRAINGFAHALREDFSERLDDQGRDYLDRICRASVRMGELIDELLALANVSRAPLVIEELDLTLIASDIVEELRLASPERQVLFQAQANLHVEGDEALLRNALTNLIGNAWKFTRGRRPAVISFTAEEEAEFIRFTLADNGIGFDMAHAKRLFQPFQQLHGNQGFGGTGIGLASVRRIIERHGGQIWAEADPEQGASFIFTLPLRARVIRRRRK